jgi:hypothetical protein
MGVYKYEWVPCLKYVLELPYVDESTPTAFAHAFSLACDAVGINYQGWLNLSKESNPDGDLFTQVADAFGTANTTQRRNSA